MNDVRSNHSNNPRLYYKSKNNQNHNNQQVLVPNQQRNIFSSSASASNNTNIIDKILPNQWLVDSVPQIKSEINKTGNNVPRINVTRLGTGGFATRSSQVYTMNGCGLENPFSNQSINTSLNNTKINIEDLINTSATPITLSTSGDVISATQIRDLFNLNSCAKLLYNNIDSAIAPNAIQKTLVNHIPDYVASNVCYGNTAYWEKMNLTSHTNDEMTRLIECVLEDIVNKSNHLKFQFTPYISPIKNCKKNSKIIFKNLLDARKLYKENTKIASAIREDCQVYRLLFEFSVSDYYFEEKDLVHRTADLECQEQIISNNFNHVEITVACSRESSSETTLIYIGAPNATNIHPLEVGYPETFFNTNYTNSVQTIFSSRSSVIPSSDQYSIVLKSDYTTDKELIGIGLCKVEDYYNTPIYVPPSLYAISTIKDGLRVKKIKVNAKGTDIDGNCPKVNIFEAGISSDKEKCLYGHGLVNNWIDIIYTLENKNSTLDPTLDDEGNYIIIELPHVNPENICVLGALIYYTNDNLSDEYVKQVEVKDNSVELNNDNSLLERIPILTDKLQQSIGAIGSSTPSVFSNSIKSFPVYDSNYVRSSLLTNILGATSPIPTNQPETVLQDIPNNQPFNSDKLKELLGIPST